MSSSSIALVIAKAMLDEQVTVSASLAPPDSSNAAPLLSPAATHSLPVGRPIHSLRPRSLLPWACPQVRRVESGQCAPLDGSKLFAVWRRAGLPCPDASRCAPFEGWDPHPWKDELGLAAAGVEDRVGAEAASEGQEGARVGLDGVRLIDPEVVMSSRDLDPVIWPKVWHFSKKLTRIGGSGAEHAATFGHVPVRWVPAVNRWMAGNRHRMMAARLNGLLCPAVPAGDTHTVLRLQN